MPFSGSYGLSQKGLYMIAQTVLCHWLKPWGNDGSGGKPGREELYLSACFHLQCTAH